MNHVKAFLKFALEVFMEAGQRRAETYTKHPYRHMW